MPETPAVTLTGEQPQVLDKIMAWKRSGYRSSQTPGVFKLMGQAGTGKSTLLNVVKDQFAAPIITTLTGKAASVLRAKGMSNAINIHQLIYALAGFDQDTKEPIFYDNGETLEHADVILLDEASMIDARTADDLLSRGIPVIACGDPSQLPPVKGLSWFAGDADGLLETIQRQAWDSPIIRAATWIRRGDISRGLQEIDARPAGSVGNAELLAFDQILVGKHDTRKKVNTRVRALLRFPAGTPVIGDKVVCRRNQEDRGLFNGEVYTVVGVGAKHVWTARHKGLRIEVPSWKLQVEAACGKRQYVTAAASVFADGDPFDVPFAPGLDCFGFAYALTVHASQGSEWDSVALRLDWNGNNYQEWLYTGLTRAKTRVLLLS